jgi:hypothetical protein
MRNAFTSKKASDAFTAQLTAVLIAGLGLTSPDVAEAIINGKRFVVNTDLGEMEGKFMQGSAYDPARPRTYSVGWVHFRFRDAARAKASTLYVGVDGRLNGYSGKWNWMFSAERYEWELPVMVEVLRRLNPTVVAIIE